MDQTTNETFVFDVFDELCPPPLLPLHFGGSAPHCPDIAVVDISATDAPFLKLPKASYIISDTRLFLHEASADPWNVKEVFARLSLGDDFNIRDKQTKLSKRACGAKRVSSSSGPLIGNDSRIVSMSLRYWVDYPESYIDLQNKDHLKCLSTVMAEQREALGHMPPATFEAKLDDKCQYVGPNVATSLRYDGVKFEMRSGAESLNAEEIIAFLDADNAVQENVFKYMAYLGVTQSPFKVVPSEREVLAEGETRENVYNEIELNMVLSRNFNLCSAMFNRSTTVRLGNGISEEAQGPPQTRLKEAPQQEKTKTEVIEVTA